MIIRAIDLENIRSHKSSHIEFKNGITVITGDVGSGKTTIMEAIKGIL
jgi:ATPase involved in DNA repair